MISDIFTSVSQKNSAEDWLVALGIVAGCILVSRLFYLVSGKGIKPLLGKTPGKLAFILLDMLEEPFAMLIVIFGFHYAQRRLYFPASVDAIIDKVANFAVILTLTWAIARLVKDLIQKYLVPAAEKSESKLDDQLLPIAQKAGTILIWAIGIVVAIDQVGYNVGTIVAGLGIGGLAFAFAAQETIANLFGGVTVFVDAPFVIGDRIKIAGYEGFVREIGLRTSRLETLDGRRLSIPNSHFSSNVIENVSSEPATRVIETMGVACNQKAGLIEKAAKLFGDVIAAESDLEPRSRAYLKEFGSSSYDFELILWFKKDTDILAARNRFNLALIKSFEEAGIEFSLPMCFITGDRR